MNLTPLTSKTDITNAYRALVKRLKAGATKYRRVVGWKGGSDEFTLYWHPREKFWVLSSIGASGGYWCPYGTSDPSQSKIVSITCEINPPSKGTNRRKAGVLLRDARGDFYLAHTGKVAGGRAGIGKAAFLENYGGALQEVEWADGVTTEVVVLGKIESATFSRNLSTYIHDVEEFKAGATGQTPKLIAQSNPDLAFTPEFEGPKKKYKLSGAIQSQCDHGTVVNTLHAQLKTMSLEPYKTGKIDLFLADKDGNITHLLEVKTDQTTTSLYQAVGQVMLHGALAKCDPRRILVLPGEISGETASRMKRLGITILRYEWKGNTPVFRGLKKGLFAD